MNRKNLQEKLAALQAELTSATTVDEETRARLAALANEIHRLSEQEPEESQGEVGPLSASLQDYVLKFETDHPQLTNALNQVSAALANLGI